jgi:phage/plasmid-like protein (TIGR03299 family)
MDYFDSGFCVREPSWHGKENLLAEAPKTWDEARIAAGLEWEPISVPVYVQAGGTEDAPAYAPLAGFQAIARSDTQDVLAVPTSSFSLISHASMGQIIEGVLGDRLAAFDTAGSVKGGRAVWAMVRLDEPFTVPGDDTATYPYLCILNSHDGSGACKVLYCLVRVVCWNTWQAASAEGDRTGYQFTFRHSGDVATRISEAREALAGLRTAASDYRDMMGELGRVRVDDAMVATFLHEFIASPADRGEQITPRVAANIAEARALFTALYDESPTVDAVRGTGYGLLMASTEYLDHLRGFRTRDSYVGRTVLRPEAAKQRAASLIRELAAA